MKFTKKIVLAMIAICLMMSLASCQDDGIEVTEEQFIQACKDGDADLVEKALKKNKKLINAKDKEDTPALILASQRKHKSIVELLISKGADVNAKDKNDRSALYWAFDDEYGEIDKEILDLLIAKGANLKAATNYGWTILMDASRSGFKDIVELAIKKGADVNAKTKSGDTALNLVVDTGNKEIVELLITNGADVNTNSRFGTPLLYACGSHKYFFISCGLEYAKDCVLNNDIVKLLISKGADVNASNEDGWSALLFAAACGELEIVKTLVENGADIAINFDTGENAAIKIAQDTGHAEVAEYIKQKLAKLPLSQRGEYVRVNNWKEVKLKQKEFIGKKITIRTKYRRLSFDGIEIDLDLDGMVGCRFDKKLVDKIISLREDSYYTFYGTVKEGDWITPVFLYIEEIE